jgi:hypothetical protein
MGIVEGVIAALCILSILFFLVYVAGMIRMPTGFRPKTPVYNRYGQQTGTMENPGYQETTDEEE